MDENTAYAEICLYRAVLSPAYGLPLLQGATVLWGGVI